VRCVAWWGGGWSGDRQVTQPVEAGSVGQPGWPVCSVGARELGSWRVG
jgi:hypothetical protein